MTNPDIYSLKFPKGVNVVSNRPLNTKIITDPAYWARQRRIIQHLKAKFFGA